MTVDSQTEDAAAKVLADALVGIVTGQMELPQAVQSVDNFCDALKGKLAEQDVLALRTRLLDSVFSVKARQRREEDQVPATERSQRRRSAWEFHDNFVVPITPQDALDELAEQLWERRIKPMLPAHILNDPKLLNRTARNIGFLVGLWGEKVALGLVRTLMRLRGD